MLTSVHLLHNFCRESASNETGLLCRKVVHMLTNIVRFTVTWSVREVHTSRHWRWNVGRHGAIFHTGKAMHAWDQRWLLLLEMAWVAPPCRWDWVRLVVDAAVHEPRGVSLVTVDDVLLLVRETVVLLHRKEGRGSPWGVWSGIGTVHKPGSVTLTVGRGSPCGVWTGISTVHKRGSVTLTIHIHERGPVVCSQPLPCLPVLACQLGRLRRQPLGVRDVGAVVVEVDVTHQAMLHAEDGGADGALEVVEAALFVTFAVVLWVKLLAAQTTGQVLDLQNKNYNKT